MPPDNLTHDLTETSEFTFSLLADTQAWRHRLVEEFEIGSRWHAVVTSSYQVELPRDLLAVVDLSRVDAVRALLPLTTRPKRPLLGFGIRGPGGAPAHLPLRVSIAAIQAEYLARLRDGHPRSEALATRLPDSLLEAICVFTPSVYREFDPEGRWTPSSAAAYLSAGLGFEISQTDVAPLCERQGAAMLVLAEALHEPADPFSSSEGILLAIPRLDPLPTSLSQVQEVVDGYASAVVDAQQGPDNGFLVALAEYGRRWEVIVETVISVHEPSTVALVEQRPLELRRRRTRQRVALGDARSAHAQFQISDPAVELERFGVEDVFGNQIGVPYLEGVRETAEAFAIYSGDPERPFFADVELRLRPALDLRLTAFALELLVLVAAVLAATFDGSDLTTVLALVTVPTTFAVALSLVREQTSLAAHLQRWARRRLLAEASALWLVVFARLI